jgi:hypothetical protein
MHKPKGKSCTRAHFGLCYSSEGSKVGVRAYSQILPSPHPPACTPVSPVLGKSLAIAVQELDVNLRNLSLVLCDDKPASFGAPDVLQASRRLMCAAGWVLVDVERFVHHWRCNIALAV